MLYLFTSIGIVVLFFLASGFFMDKPSQEISSLIAGPLPQEISTQLKDIEYTHHDTTISVDDYQLEVFPFMEDSGIQNGEHFLGIRFEIQVNGKKDERLTFGVVGNGTSRNAAQQDAVFYWWAAFAAPLISSIADKTTDFGPSGYVVFPGATVVRGKPPGGWMGNSKEMHQKIITALLIGEKQGIKAIDLKVMVDPFGQVGGEGRVNGHVSQEILEGLRKLNWPTTDNKYLLYQVYILKHKNEAQPSLGSKKSS